ncbi:MAG: transaldolase, partial [Smithella sp.]
MNEANLNFFLGSYENSVSQTLEALQKDKIIQRIRAADYTVWKPKPDNIVNRLGWLHAPADLLDQLPYIRSVLDPIIAEGYKDAVLLGMGGSSLAAEMYVKMFGCRSGHPLLRILDTTDPAAISRISQELDWEKTIFLVSSKSGTTLETVSLFYYFYNLALKKSGSSACRNFIIITDPDSPLEELAHRLHLRHIFKSNPAIGGRYSALAFPGIIPATLLGIEVEVLLKNALAFAENDETCFFQGKPNSASSVLGASLGTLARMGRDKLTLIFPQSWMPFGDWVEQLIAESTGKEGKGILPVCEKELKHPEFYNNDRFFVIFHTEENVESKISEIHEAGHPVVAIKVDSKFHLGSRMFLWEMATAIAGHILGINPFDQPNVEASKILTRQMIELYRKKKEFPPEQAAMSTEECDVYGGISTKSPAEALENFLAEAKSGNYVCLQVYLKSTPETDEALHKLSMEISNKYRLAVSSGYGPRYLHSTGQLHKGDSGKGLFIQFTSDDPRDIEIPDNPGVSGSTLTFGICKSAQALGDRQALIRLGRKIIRFHLKKNAVA